MMWQLEPESSFLNIELYWWKKQGLQKALIWVVWVVNFYVNLLILFSKQSRTLNNKEHYKRVEREQVNARKRKKAE